MNIDVQALAGGAVGEKINQELQKIVENIQDLNTSSKAARKLTITVTLKPNDKRDVATVEVETRTTLAPLAGVDTTFILDKDASGKAVAAELKSGIKNQGMITDGGEIANDKGEPVAESTNDPKVVNYKFK